MIDIKKLQKEIDEYKDLFNSIPAWIFYKDTENRFIRVNEYLCKSLKIKKKEIEGKFASEIFPKEQADSFWKDDKEVILSGTPKLNIVEKITLIEDERWIRVDKIPFYDVFGKIKGIIGLAVDITDLKKAEKKSNDAQKFLEMLIETAPSPIFYKDINGVYQGCNKAFEEYLGLKKKDIIGKSVYDLCPKDLADKYHAMDKALFEKVDKQIYEYQVKYADNSRHDVIFNKATYLDAEGKPAGLIGIMIDITERKRAEEELKKLNAIMVDREMKMIELKNKIKKLETQISFYKKVDDQQEISSAKAQ